MLEKRQQEWQIWHGCLKWASSSIPAAGRYALLPLLLPLLEKIGVAACGRAAVAAVAAAVAAAGVVY